ncbi:hypothetical protein LB553_00920 [Mesorhizobium sp. CA8]|uniref:hypothetical protein n=1 Tax=Mesorhizobium sp. CA8 TaxID=2876637 RepID=UPI001CCAE411|nr:hypothetical protein [Mesorhizobium sp. CA8]MBZ9759449.1 hypothetical protein [Mesorhizobium sp. CA8]
MISKETATDIAYAYREIETAEKLLTDIAATMDKSSHVDIRDAFGRRADGLQLGIPTSDTGRTLYQVPWPLARPIIEAHIAAKKAALSALNEKARFELDAA